MNGVLSFGVRFTAMTDMPSTFKKKGMCGLRLQPTRGGIAVTVCKLCSMHTDKS